MYISFLHVFFVMLQISAKIKGEQSDSQPPVGYSYRCIILNTDQWFVKSHCGASVNDIIRKHMR